MNAIELSWLSGFWDGEGSIGLVPSRTTFILQVQLSNTHYPSVERCISILTDHGVRVRGPYTYKERSEWHKPAVSIRVSGLGNVRRMAELLEPYAVTKREQWRVALEWTARRIEAAGGLNEQGHVKRGGVARRGYDEQDHALVRRLSDLNDSRRGGRSRGRREPVGG